MKYQPNRNYESNDKVMTPRYLASQLVQYFKPCVGSGNIYDFLEDADWCEIDKGRDFYNYNHQVDYIFTNPPWSDIENFLIKSLAIAKKDVYFLCTINHLWTKSRQKIIKENGFYIKEILCFDTPKEFPQSGFQCGMIHLKKGKGKICKINYLRTTEEE